MELFMYSEKDNVLYINTDAIMKGKSIKERMAYFNKSYSERIAESQYRKEIEAEIAKYAGCKISEFCPV